MIRHFYHVYADGAWMRPVGEHLAALRAAGLDPAMTVGIVGSGERRRQVREVVAEAAAWRPAWVQAAEGHEEVTLLALQRWCRRNPGGQVLYCHSKGAGTDSAMNAAWRRSMTRHVVGQWQECVRLLRTGEWDTVGCHWLTEADNAPPEHPVDTPFYGGNFWWASTDYVAQLPPLTVATRHDCETWLGRRRPRAYDLLPGWPSMELCRDGGT